jgi:hypothetical protein
VIRPRLFPRRIARRWFLKEHRLPMPRIFRKSGTTSDLAGDGIFGT